MKAVLSMFAMVFCVAGATAAEIQLTASDGAAFDAFGSEIAVNGNWIVVGAPGVDDEESDQGAAYVFTRRGKSWIETQKLTMPDAAAGAAFGSAIAMNEQYLAISAPGSYAYADPGAVFIYRRAGREWLLHTTLSPAGAAYSGFGSSVAIDGRRLIAGAPLLQFFAGTMTSGGAWIYEERGGNWETVETILSMGNSPDWRFGTAVAIGGAHAAISAASHESNGEVYFYQQDHPHSDWEYVSQEGWGGDRDDWLGWSLAIQEDTLAAGAPNRGDDDVGQVIVYEFADGAWTAEHVLQAADASMYSMGFGDDVALYRDYLAAGAPHAGAAYLFKRAKNGEWDQVDKFEVPSSSYGFGTSVALGKKSLMVGDSLATIEGKNSQGAVYVFGIE